MAGESERIGPLEIRLESGRCFIISHGELLRVVETYGHGAVGSLVALESVGIPLPGEAVLIAAAAVAGANHALNIWFVLETTLGDNLGFWIGRELGSWLLVRFGRYVWLTKRRIKLGQYLFLRYGGGVVFFGRFVSVLLSLAAFLARLGQVVADGGACEGRQIIPTAWIDDIAQTGSADAWDAGVFAPFFPGRKMHYRNKWYADLGEAPLLFALGIHGQYVFVDRRNQLVIVMMSSQADPLDAELISLTMTAVSHFREIFALSQ